MIDLFGFPSTKLRYQTHSVAGRKTINQTISASTTTLVTWEDEIYHTGGMHDKQSNNDRLYAPIKGRYLCWGLTQMTANGTGTYRATGVYINGISGTLRYYTGPADLAFFFTNTPALGFCFVVDLLAGDYVSMINEHDALVSLDIGISAISRLREQFGLSYMGA